MYLIYFCLSCPSHMYKHTNCMLQTLSLIYLSLFFTWSLLLLFLYTNTSLCALSPSHPVTFSLSFYLNLGCLIADWEWDWESGVFWLEHESCPVLSSPVLTHKPLFTHWGRGLCSCRYRSYLSVMSCSPGMDHNSEGNAIHGTKRMTHRLTVGKCFFVFWKFVSLLSTRNVKWLTLYWK